MESEIPHVALTPAPPEGLSVWHHRVGLLTTLLGFVLSLYAFFPGWMSEDSFTHYWDIATNTYHDTQPVLYSWWWKQLDRIYPGPGLMLLSNLLPYWGAAYLFYRGATLSVGATALAFVAVSAWPGILFPLGQLWKDILFACSLMFVWAMLFDARSHGRRLTNKQRVLGAVLLVLAFGVKTNGITAIPPLLVYWTITDFPKLRLRIRMGTIGVALLFVVSTPALLVPPSSVVRMNQFQYTQSYDLLALSVETREMLLPDYIVQKLNRPSEKILELFTLGSNNLFFYNTAGTLASLDAAEWEDLENRWLGAIYNHPLSYLAHRWRHFLALLRFGEQTPAWVAVPGIRPNRYGFRFDPNGLADLLASTPVHFPWIYFPWIYLPIGLLGLSALLHSRCDRPFMTNLAISSAAFLAPHLLVAPATDYRYLYYSIFCTLIMFAYAAALWGDFLLRQSFRFPIFLKNAKCLEPSRWPR